MKTFGVKAEPTKTGNPTATFTAVMSGQVDVGWAAPPFLLDKLEAGEIRIIARGSDVPSTRDQTVRLLVANANSLAAKRDAISRFMQAYRESLDWAYADPKAIEYYQDYAKIPPNLTRRTMREFYTRDTLDPDRITGLDQVMADAIELKFLAAPLTKEQLADLFQVPKPIP